MNLIKKSYITTKTDFGNLLSILKPDYDMY